MQNTKLFFALVLGAYSMVLGMEQEAMQVGLVSAQIQPTLERLDDGTYGWEFYEPSKAVAEIQYATEHGFDGKVVSVLNIGEMSEIEDEVENRGFFSSTVLIEVIQCLKKHNQTNLKEIYIERMNFDGDEKAVNSNFLNFRFFPSLTAFIVRNSDSKAVWSKIPPNISFLKNVTQFEVTDSKIKKIPRTIVGMANLRMLSLCDNEIATLPPQIGALSNLTELDISNNRLEKFPSTIDQLKNLIIINFSRNRITMFPQGLGQLPALARIDAHHNQIKEIAPFQPGEFCELTYLDLSGNPVAAIQGLEHTTKLKSGMVILGSSVRDSNNNNNNSSSSTSQAERRKVKVKRKFKKEDKETENKVKERLGALNDALQAIYTDYNAAALQRLAIAAKQKEDQNKKETNDKNEK